MFPSSNFVSTSSDRPDAAQAKKTILDAMKLFYESMCARFVLRTNKKDFIKIPSRRQLNLIFLADSECDHTRLCRNSLRTYSCFLQVCVLRRKKWSPVYSPRFITCSEQVLASGPWQFDAAIFFWSPLIEVCLDQIGTIQHELMHALGECPRGKKLSALWSNKMWMTIWIFVYVMLSP